MSRPRGAAFLLLLGLAACGSRARPPWFVARGAETGVDFVHDPGGGGRKLIVEINAGGVALFDADGDGRLDLYLCQGRPLPGHPAFGRPLLDALYRNEGGLRFTDVTVPSAAADAEFTYAAAPADVDGDGDVDLYLANVGPDRLLLNDGRGRFAAAAGPSADGFSSAACFADFDRDGDLDLYVARYVGIDLAEDRWCGETGRGPQWRAYCHPDEYPAAPDVLFRNEEAGRGFTDVTAAAGIEAAAGKGLGVLPFDADDDGDLDLFVANDSTPNLLWENLGALRFRDVALAAGVALDALGRAQASMGCDAADVDADGDLDLACGNMAGETHSLWVREAEGFVDESAWCGMAERSRPLVGFGARFLDADLDGDPDLLVAHGHILDNVELYDPLQRFAQPLELFENLGRGRFAPLGERGGPALSLPRVGRGLAVGDLDDDGDPDAVVAQWSGRPVLLENTRLGPAGDGRGWIGLSLRGRPPDTQALGARVTLRTSHRRAVQEVHVAGSYAAASDPRLVFALHPDETLERVEVRWPRGALQEFAGLEPGRYHLLEEAPK